MLQRSAVTIIAFVFVGLCGWAFAQQEPQVAPKITDPAGGRYAVSPIGTTAVMVESTSGKTWLLHHSADGSTAMWLPVERVDDPDKAQEWLKREEANKRELASRRAQLRQ